MSREPDALERIGAGVEPPDLQAKRLAGESLASVGVTEWSHGRLVALAEWWAGVAPGARRPDVVAHFLLVVPGPEPAGEAEGPVPTGDVVRLLLPGDVDAAIERAAAAVDSAVDAGTDLILLSAPDRLAARVLATHLIDIDAVEATGWPGQAGLDDAAWAREVAALRNGLRRISGLRGVPVQQVRAVGSPVIAAATAALLQTAARRTPVILDGPSAAAAALLAQRVTDTARAWWLAAGGVDDPLATRVLEGLWLDPLVRLDLRIEDGTAARLGLAVLRAATALLDLAGHPADPAPSAPPAVAPAAGSSDG